MSQPLPTHGFQWLLKREIDQLVLMQLADNAPDGYIFEVDLDNPLHLHRKHNAYPLAPERLDETMMPSLQRTFPKDQQQTTTKSSPNLNAKHNYVVHYRNLKLYLEQGMVITKIHRVLKFNQSPWLKPYIQFNTRMRAAATSQFEKDLFKLMNNSVFGKTQENLRNRINVEAITNENVALNGCVNLISSEVSLLKSSCEPPSLI